MINNFPEYAKDKKFIVYRIIDDEKWFYGAYDEQAKAVEVSAMIDGYIA